MTDISGFSLGRPNAIRTYQGKYGGTAPISPYIQSTSPLVQRALQNYDRARVNQGQSPLSNAQTRVAGQTLGTLTTTPGVLPFLPGTVHADATTPAPDRPWWQDAVSDAQQIFTAIPKVPGLLVQEGAQIPQIPTLYQEATAKSTNPLETLGNLAQLPVARLVPGSFTLSQFGTGGQGVGGLTEHPLMTALDVLPYAEKGASLTKTASAADDVAARAADITGTLPTRTTPLGSVLKYGHISGPEEIVRPRFAPYMDTGVDIPALRPNILGKSLDVMGKTLLGQGNPVGRGLGSIASPGVREFSRLRNRRTSDLEYARANPDYQAPGLTTDVTNPAQNVDATVAAAQIAHDTDALMSEFSDITPERKALITRTIESPTGAALPTGFSPREQEFVDRYVPLKDAYTQDVSLASGRAMEVPFDHGPEIYDTATGTRIKTARYQRDTALAANNLRDALDPTSPHTVSPDVLHSDMARALSDSGLSVSARGALAKAYLGALEAAGVDTSAARAALSASQNAVALQSLSYLVDPRTARPIAHSLESIADALEPLRSKSFPVNRFLTAMKRGDDVAAMKEVGQLRANRAVNDILTASNIDLSRDLPLARDIRKAQNAGLKALSAKGFTPSETTRMIRKAADTEAANPPARFQSILEENSKAPMADAIRASGQPQPVIDKALDQITNSMFKDARTTFPELVDVQREIRATWQELAARGDDPVFVHHTPPSKLASAAYPQVADHITSPGQFKARLWDSGPTYSDLGVALHHQAMEYLGEQGTRAFLQSDLPSAFTRTLSDLRDQYASQAAELAVDSPMNLEAHLDSLIKKGGWEAYDPESFISGTAPAAGRNPATQLMIPSEIGKALRSLQAKPSDLGQVISAPMNLFRTSVLPLSPRWHVNNILGGAITTSLRAENPLTVWKNMRKAWRMAKAGGPDSILDDITLTPTERQAARLLAPGGSTRQATEWFRNAPLKTSTERLEILNKYAAGRTLRRLFDEGAGSRLKGIGEGIVQKSYDFNQTVDDMYRSMAYLEGSDKALTRGMSRAEQIRAGVQASRSMLQNWDTLTPIERSTMRMVFPFYSWARFMMKYVMTYPGDHPWRTEILASLSRTEGHDYGSGIPQDLRTLLFFGNPDDQGNVNTLNTGGFNPFRDTSNYFSLLGFLGGGGGNVAAVTSQLNPAFSTLAQWAGVDPASGMADLYPELQYDPATGRMVAGQKQNPLLGAIGNFIPQVNAVTAFAGINNQYRDLARRDPAAAGRYLASTVGVPVLYRQVNLNQKVVGAEVTRYNAMKQTLVNGLTQGDLGSFRDQYPGLHALTSRLDTLSQTPAFRARYGIQTGQPGSYNPSAVDILKQAGRTALPVA